ncbi:MAG: hypothetical protein HUJ99_04950 [Bacteroidaceae bacterium]|nr:hypothetical protein [Bacteroidaceae bacterium]
MKRLSHLLLLLICLPALSWGQDNKPTQIKAEDTLKIQNRHLSKLHGIQMGDTNFEFSPTPFPRSFVHIKPNRLINGEALTPFFNKMADRHQQSVRVVQIGDSHVRGHVFPRELRHRLEEAWGSEAMLDAQITYKVSAIATETGTPGFVFSALAKNGVTLAYYEEEKMQEEIASLHPDMLIISLGTNESHAPHFDAHYYLNRLHAFVNHMKARCPDLQFMFTTPPGSHVGAKRRGRRRGATLSPNLNTPQVVSAQVEFATSQNIPLWNLYEIAGGSSFACENWRSSNLMAADGIHFTPDGYTLQGRLLAEAILYEWNKYLKRQ